MAYKRFIKKIQSFKTHYLQEVKTIDMILIKDLAFLFGCIVMIALSFMFTILLMEVLLWMK
jgi:hypothetical protein